MKGRTRTLITGLVFIVGILIAEGVIRIAGIPAFVLPAPSKVAVALWRGLSSGIYVKHLMVTMTETMLGFALGAILGVGIGTLVALNRYVDIFLYPYVVAFQSLPKVALAPLMAIWFGVGMTSKVLSAALIAFFPLLVNVIAGLRSVDEDRLNLMGSLAATETQIFWKLRLPAAMPFVLAGIDVAIVFSLIGAIVGEFMGATQGLGYLIQSYNFEMDVSGSFSVLIILSMVGMVLHKTVALLRKRLLFWDPSEKNSNDPPFSA
jgi:NitT/TauT family transport system permease protein